MSDRCYMVIHAKNKNSIEILEAALGYPPSHDYSEAGNSLWAELHFEGINYGGHDEIREACHLGAVFYGRQYGGDDYGPSVFVCDGDDIVECNCDYDGYPVAGVSRTGADKDDLVLADSYYKLLDKVKEKDVD